MSSGKQNTSVFLVLLIVLGISVFAIISIFKNNFTTFSSNPSASHLMQQPSNEDSAKTTPQNNVNAVWLSYFELSFKGLDFNGFKSKIDTMFDNIKAVGFNTVICQVRPMGDAFYKSDYFPWSEFITGTQGLDPGFDPLEYMVTAAHKKELKIEAWINPYRLSSTAHDLSVLADTNFAKSLRNDSDASNDNFVICAADNKGVEKGIYYNPASSQIQQLVINGVREIVDKYSVDGIHFDDYFYPTTSEEFDIAEYTAYKNSSLEPLSLGDWRRANVDSLIQGVYRVTSQKNVRFGISPSAHISDNYSDSNYTKQYANIIKWMSNKGFIDYIAPQLYFGYDYPKDEFKFSNLLSQWLALPQHNDLNIYIGLAGYKIGALDANSSEWKNNHNILERQIIDSYNMGANGIFLFSYDSIINNRELNKAQIDGVKSALCN